MHTNSYNHLDDDVNCSTAACERETEDKEKISSDTEWAVCMGRVLEQDFNQASPHQTYSNDHDESSDVPVHDDNASM